MDNQLAVQEENFEFNAEEMSLAIAKEVKDSPEVLALSKEINLEDSNTIMKFGEETAGEITQLADQILSTMKNNTVESSGAMLKQLNAIMEKFDAQDFAKQEEPGFFDKLFGGAKNSIDHLLKKYETMGGEVDKVYAELKGYEREIQTTNGNLENMFNTNVKYYENLQKYIYAGQHLTEKLKNEDLKLLEDKASTSGEEIDHISANNLRQSIDMIEQRIYDLELAKNVALQSLPQIKMIEKGNYNLMRKINSAFIVTLPIFKQSLTQAIALKRQGIQAEAMAALDQKTNELLLKNAENTATQSKLTAELASGASIDVETLEKTWQTILNGIEETKRIQSESAASRQDGIKRLQQINDEFKAKSHA